MSTSLPFSFIEGLRASIDALRGAVLSGQFPDLSDEPGTVAEIADAMASARAWALGVSTSYGAVATQECGHVFPEPRPLLVWFRGGSGSQPSPAPRLDRAADVLGDIPDSFRACRADSFLASFGGSMGRPQGTFVVHDRSRRRLELTVANWPDIRTAVNGFHLMTVVQAMQLIALVRQRISDIEHAVIPEICRIAVLERNRVQVEVRMAGATRTTEIPNAEADFLDSLATVGRAKARRQVKLELVRTIPELGMWITNAPARPGGKAGRVQTENESWYQMADVIRKGIKSAIASEWNAEGTQAIQRK